MEAGLGRAIRVGALYFALVFGLGFVLGTIRTLLLEGRLGALTAALIELPVMLAAAWLLCGWVLRSSGLSPQSGARLTMGATAFLLLMLAELGVSTFLLGRTPAEHLATYRLFDKQLGLAAQLAFAAFPLLRRQARPSASSA